MQDEITKMIASVLMHLVLAAPPTSSEVTVVVSGDVTLGYH
jgi:hypothetical protein